tara:strand:- start:1381 stop:1812 length:432 start_codon:yes stop_codon:yes gene_type:complete
MLKAANPNFKERVHEKIEANIFGKFMGFKITDIEVGRVRGEMPMAEHLFQQDNFAHGGAVASVADIVAGFAAYTLAAENEFVVTAEIKISFFKPCVGDKVEAIGWVLKPGSRMHFCESEVYVYQGSNRVLVAKASATMAVVKK